MNNFEKQNSFKLVLPAMSVNESFSRSIISGFVSRLDPTVEELCDIKTAVSEAITNCIVHAYNKDYSDSKRLIYISGSWDLETGLITIKIRDRGCGIPDVKKAMEPLYTTGNEDRSGMGFTIMESFTDKLTVKSSVGKGTSVTLKKYIGKQSENGN